PFGLFDLGRQIPNAAGMEQRRVVQIDLNVLDGGIDRRVAVQNSAEVGVIRLHVIGRLPVFGFEQLVQLIVGEETRRHVDRAVQLRQEVIFDLHQRSLRILQILALYIFASHLVEHDVRNKNGQKNT